MLEHDKGRELVENYSHQLVVEAIREVTEKVREKIPTLEMITREQSELANKAEEIAVKLEFDDGLEAGIIDVPGHEKFIKP